MLKLPAIVFGICGILVGLERRSITLCVCGLAMLLVGLLYFRFDFGATRDDASRDDPQGPRRA